jgi:hypothetical protein
MLTEEEEGSVLATTSGNALRDDTILKVDGKRDTLADLKLSTYQAIGGKNKIKTLPDPLSFCPWRPNISLKNVTASASVPTLCN